MDAKCCGDGDEEGQQGRAKRGMACDLARCGRSSEHNALENTVEPYQLVQFGLDSDTAASVGLNA